MKLTSTDPVLYSYPAEVQTFSMRSKGMLVWNAITQIEYTYITFVDAVALEAIGELPSFFRHAASKADESRIQVLCCLHASHHYPVVPCQAL